MSSEMSDTDIVADLRECAAESRALEGDYYADQFATAPEIFERAADEIERLRTAIRRLAEQDATLSLLCRRDGSQVVTVTMDATLTDFERASIMRAIETLEGVEYIEAFATENDATAAATLRGLLERLGGGVR